MGNVRRVYAEKKPEYAVAAQSLYSEIKSYLGIDTALREAGCQDGDTVRLLGFEFEFIEN